MFQSISLAVRSTPNFVQSSCAIFFADESREVDEDQNGDCSLSHDLSQVAYDMGIAPIFALKSITTVNFGLDSG